MSVLDGRAMAAQIREDLKGEVSALRARGVVPALAVVMLGDDPAARAYVRGIERASAAVDVACTVRRLPADAAHEDLARTLDELSADPAVHGIILQTPLPPQIDALRLGARIAVRKDVD
ncbi:MAG TPA: tetrahydrofolate dehydrogenase/cyclohydrolase catalytic domain-containing protein, partial [Chloroflexota bacterium]|nr:tetrahydrofolate dehydrogenase/cyclohydrolase catalytic domain-containing protein [Chloroflexota bacterium]